MGWQTDAMTSRRFVVGLAVGVLVLTASACSDEQSSADSSSTTSTSTSTTVADTTTSSSSTTSSTSTTSTTTTIASTTTVPVVKGLDLSATGLGDALFGADADETIAYVSSIIGAPNNDSGWQDPISIGAACPGTTIRFVDWHDLALFFTDESPAASGLPHFASYTYGPAVDGATVNPFGLTTAAGLGVGGSVEFLRATYPGAKVNGGDDISGPSFYIEDGLSGFLTGASNADTIISFVGGFGCGE